MPFALISPLRRRAPALHWLVLLAGFVLLTPNTRAQVVFQREITGMGERSAINNGSSAPFDLSDPLYDSSKTYKPWVVTAARYYTINPTDGVSSVPGSFPASVRRAVDSHASFAGRNTSKPIVFVLGYRNDLFVVDLSGPTPVTVGPPLGVSVPVGLVSSMAAADRTHLTMIVDGWFQTINITTGENTPIFSLDGGTGPGQFSNEESAGAGRETRYHTYGQNGLLYVLDYGNDRMQILDPDNAFAYVSEFSLDSSVTTANMSFAIGVNGNIYLGDGQGGGSAYSATGAFLGAFTPPIVPTPPSLYPGLADYDKHFIDTDAAGNVYVYDGISQLQYRDMSVVPEPSTVALIVGAGIALLTLSRRRVRFS